MAGTNVGAVYLDLRLNITELTKGFDDIGGRVAGLESVLEGLQQSIISSFTAENFGAVFSVFDNMALVAEPFLARLGEMGERIGGLIGQMPDLTSRFLENVDVQARVQEALFSLAERAKGFTDAAGDMRARLLQVPFDGLRQGALGLDGSIGGLVQRAGEFGSRWAGVVSGALDGVGNLKSNFLQAFGVDIPGGFVSMTAGAMEAVGGLKNGLLKIFGVDIPNGFSNMLAGMQEGWRSAWGGMKSAFSGIINRIIGGFNSMIGGLNRFRVDVPAWLGGGSFGMNIPKIPQVPALARGGIVDAPTLALIGERGREAVLPLENNTAWMGEFANVLAATMAGQGGYGQGSGQGQAITLNLDGRKVAEGIIDDIYSLSQRRDMGAVFA